MSRRAAGFAWLLLVLAFAGATACAGSCAPRRGPDPVPAQPAP